jgi:uncharacterized protein YabN with tetrapyrrole methylase and pyrophosphatase domain
MALRQPSSENGKQREIEAEFGDVLFSLVNLSRFIKVNPEDALRQTVNRFIRRFQYIERHAAESGRAIGDLSVDEMNRLWEDAKREPPRTA